jgi:two-component system LytT family sensor kinase
MLGHFFLFAIEVPRAYVPLGEDGASVWDWGLVIVAGWRTSIEALITPFILLAGYRFRLHRQKLLRNLGLHFLLACVAGAVYHLSFHLTQMVAFQRGLIGFGAPFDVDVYYANIFRWLFFVMGLPPMIVRYAAIIAIQQAYLYFKESQARANLLRESELQVLKMQLHPHFFFNTLNAISALAYRAPDEATRLIARLGDMFRISLQKDKAQEIRLKEEIEFLEAFLHIHKTLMGRRLRVEWEIAPETLDALVPNMLLQPIVENAITHGLAPLESGGTVSIVARREAAGLVVEVRDNGRGFGNMRAATEGIGLSNTRARLANLYGEHHEIWLSESPDGGAAVRIILPFREHLRGRGDED